MTSEVKFPQAPLRETEVLSWAKSLTAQLVQLAKGQSASTIASIIGSSGTSVPAGTIITFGGNAAPPGYLPCDGGLYLTVDYPALYAAIGTFWNVGGEPPEAFRVPNLVDRFIRGGNTAGYGGADSFTIAQANLPNVNFNVTDAGHSHSAVDAGHIHTITTTPHSHTADAPHSHAASSPEHGHFVIDGQHSHNYPARVATNFGVTAGPANIVLETASGSDLISTNTAASNVSIAGTAVSVTVQSTAPVVTVNSTTVLANAGSAAAVITVNSAVTGLTVGSGGSGTPITLIPSHARMLCCIRAL